MTSRLDELFSPERLRQNWQQVLVPEISGTQNIPNAEIHAQYHELQKLIAEKFTDVSKLSGRFEKLSAQMHQTFPLNTNSDPVSAKQKQLIITMLEQLEELLWAMGLSQGGIQ